MKAEKKDETALRITDQFRSRTGMNYDLKANGSRLTLLVSPRATPEDPGEWRVEASSSQVPGSTPIVCWAPSKLEAIRDVGVAWSAEALLHGLPSFNWEAVSTALRAVRAV